MYIEYNKGIVIRGINGYTGILSVDGAKFDISCTFWSNKKPNFIWLQRIKEKKFNSSTNTFTSYTPKPFFECYAYKTKKNNAIDYIGEFMFIGFKYELKAWFEDRTEKQLNIEVRQTDSQPILRRLNEINKNKYKFI